VGIIHVEVVGCFYGRDVASHMRDVEGGEVDEVISQLSVPEALRVHNGDFPVERRVGAGTGTDDNHTSQLFGIRQTVNACDWVGQLRLSQAQES
jgi:hypothetical protein